MHQMKWVGQDGSCPSLTRQKIHGVQAPAPSYPIDVMRKASCKAMCLYTLPASRKLLR